MKIAQFYEKDRIRLEEGERKDPYWGKTPQSTLMFCPLMAEGKGEAK